MQRLEGALTGRAAAVQRGASLGGVMGLTIAQIGPWPAPWGGIAIYVQRLSRQLAAAGHKVVVLDRNGHQLTDPSGVQVHPVPDARTQAARAARVLSAVAADVAHLHLIGLPWKTVAPFVAACDAVGVPLVISVHSLRDDRPVIPAPERMLMRCCGARLAYAFGSGAHVADGLIARGFPAAKVRYVAPFVPPTRAEPVDARLPGAVRAFCAAHGPIVAAGAASLARMADGADLYGFDVFVALAGVVAQAMPRAGFIFQLPRRGDEALYADGLARATALGLGDRLLIHDEALEEASDLWAVADLFVRPTRTDGDSVSVREALSLGTPTLASDVVARPEGVLLFANGDGDDAGRAALAALRNLGAARTAVQRLEQPNDVQLVAQTLVDAAGRGGVVRHAWRWACGALS